MEWVPGASMGLMVDVALDPLPPMLPVTRDGLPSVTVAPLNVSVKVTLPVGVAMPAVGLTIVERLVGRPAMAGLGIADKAVPVWVRLTVCVMGMEAMELKLLLPGQDAVMEWTATDNVLVMNVAVVPWSVAVPREAAPS